MQISMNTTGMAAGLSVATDKEGRDHCVVVIKGTYEADPRGELTLSQEQQPLVYADEHYGDPEMTCIRYECDFAPEKPFAEVIVVGKAVAPDGKPVSRLSVRLEVQRRVKQVTVTGDRRWLRTSDSVEPSRAMPFTEMPLTFERAFGGEDDSLGPGKASVELRNLHGVGFNPHRPRAALEGQPLPNLEHPAQLISAPRQRPDPIGLGVLGRGYAQRVEFAGTYDQHWLDEVCPFLPSDFDPRYFMSAPSDQWFPQFRGGEIIRCLHMAEQRVVQYTLPELAVPVHFKFDHRDDTDTTAKLDTVIVEPHLSRAILCWRISIPLGKKLNQLREIFLGARKASAPPAEPLEYRAGKPYFHELNQATSWLSRRDRP
jgi:hypothetical protein